MTPRQSEILVAFQRNRSLKATARELEIEPKTVRKALDAIGWDTERRAEYVRDPAVAAAMAAVGTKVQPGGMWLKTDKDENGIARSVYIPAQAIETDTIAERFRDALEGLTPSPPVLAPASVVADLCNVFLLFDVHFGAHAWGKATRGQDYDINLAKSDLKEAFESVLLLTQQAAEAVLIVGGDFFHADDNSAETPANRHKLDVDGRYDKVIDEAVEVMGYVIDRIRERHKHLTICVIRGNHDEHSHVALRVGLGQRFRLDERVTVETSLDGLFMKQWGRSAIFAHHGDKAPPERQALYLSDVCPFWTQTRHRHYYTGHIHKESARDLGPVKWESLRAFCPPDSYASAMGYASRRALKADTFHKVKGRVASYSDPIERIE